MILRQSYLSPRVNKFTPDGYTSSTFHIQKYKIRLSDLPKPWFEAQSKTLRGELIYPRREVGYRTMDFDQWTRVREALGAR
jgi:hypothetical protein